MTGKRSDAQSGENLGTGQVAEVPAREQQLRAPYAAARAAFIQRQPMGRLGEASEVAALALYLASDEAAFTTGQCHIIDGGWTT